MSNILSYGFYFPQFQIEDKVLSPKFGRKGKRIISYVDEDIITMAFAAAKDCLNKKSPKQYIDGILFASTSPVFKNRYHASFLADLLNLPKSILALDFGQTPRAGTDALIMANHLVNAGVYKNILVVTTESEYPEIGEEVRNSKGHVACAMILSNEEGIASIKSANSFDCTFAEEFIYKNSKITYDPRFSREEGFKDNINSVLAQLKLEPTAYDAIILNTSFAKLGGGVFMAKGFQPAQFAVDTIINQTGNTGSCHAILQLIDTIENSKKNFLLFDYFNGTNVLEINATSSESVKTLQPGISGKKQIATYQDYLALRKAGDFNAPGYKAIDMFTSEMMNEREKGTALYLHGFQCDECQTIYFIKSARCKKCGCENFSRKEMQERGTIYALTHEHYFPSSFPPVIMVVIDLDGGGRITVQMTDDMYADEKNKVKIGVRVKLGLRKMMENGIKPGYFYKATLL